MYKREKLPQELYEKMIVVTNRKLCQTFLPEQIEKLCTLHPHAVIVREKDLTEESYRNLAGQVRQVCKKQDVSCIYHNFIETAKKDQVKEIHLPLWKLREKKESISQQFSLIGSSVHSVEEAIVAESMGADYLIAGHIYPTECKKDLAPRGISFLKEICNSVKIPIYAIGGIHLDRQQIDEVLECGAHGFCIMSELMKIDIDILQ